MIVKVELTGIVWDTDGEDVDLPTTMTVEVDRDDGEDDESVFDRAVDQASDEKGWCIQSIGENKIV